MEPQQATQVEDDLDLIDCLLANEEVVAAETNVITVCDDERRTVLSYAQRRLWVLHQLDPDSTAYNISAAVHLFGPLNVTALAASLQEIIRRHEVLRSSFRAVDGQPFVHITSECDIPLPESDLRHFPAEDREAQVQSYLELDGNAPFDLEHSPLLRVRLLRLEEKSYVAILTMHHLVSDAWSMGILMDELGQLYSSFVRGESPALPAISIQYADFSAWQRQQSETARFAEQLAYWKRHLTNLSRLELPEDQARTVSRTRTAATQTFTIPRTVVADLKQLGHAEGATLFMTLLAAFQALLHRYTQQDDIVVGTPIANRNRREIEPLIGFFINTLVLRTDVSGQPSFRTLLRHVRDMALAAYANQDVPFDMLVHELAPERAERENPLVRVMFTFQNAPARPLHLPDLTLTAISIPPREAKFDLTLSLEESEGTLTGGFEYNSNLFEAKMIVRMTEHFQALLKAASANPDGSISRFPILSSAETQKLLVDWNGGSGPYPRDSTIPELFERHAKLSPNSIAVECGAETLTYRDLDERSNRLARYLQHRGVSCEDMVAVCFEPGTDMVVALLGVLKAGAVYVPLNPAYPAARLAMILDECRTRLALTQKALRDTLPDGQVETICLDRDWPMIAEVAPDRLADISASENLAYVVYTSGSTGEPKGISVSHRAVIRLVCNTNYIILTSDDRIAQVSNLAFDAITFEVWGALLHGARLVALTRGTALSPPELAGHIRDDRITVLFLTTALFNQIAQVCPTAFAPLRHLLFGGEAVDPKSVRQVLECGSPQRLIHVYGPTESTTFATWHLVTEVPDGAGTIPIGTTLSNTEAYVLDAQLQPVPPGAAGELYLGGDGLARGYWAHPALTATSFIPHPFTDEPGMRLYRTGDRVRFGQEGQIEFLGRIDEQIKLRGFRIEPREIELALAKHPAVRETVVLARDEANHNRRLVAYVVPKLQKHLEPGELRSFLRASLPDFMIPAYFVELESFPLTENGKVNRKALPAPPMDTHPDSSFEQPRSDSEQLLAKVWEAVLGRQRIGIHDSYFELGGDSINAIQVVSRLKRDGRRVEVRDLFRHPTIAGLAPHLRADDRPFDQAPVIGQVPLTPVQRWFFQEHTGDLHHFNQSVFLRCQKRVDPLLLRAVLSKLQEHHDALRAVYHLGNGTAVQENAASQALSFEVVDFRSETGETRHRDDHADAVQGSGSLEHGPRFKAVLYRMAHEDQLLLIVHHLVVDGVSWRILLHDLELGYAQQTQGHPIDFGSKTASFLRWAQEIERRSTRPELIAEVDHWSACAGSPQAVDGVFGSCRLVQVKLSADETQTLLSNAHRAYNTEINDILLTALGRALKRWCGESQMWITLEGHGREPFDDSLDLSRTVGWFTSLYPFLLDTPGDDKGDQIKRIKEALRRVPRKGIGYGILKYVTPETLISQKLPDLPPVTFNYLGQFEDAGHGAFFNIADETPGQPVSPKLRRLQDLDIGGIVVRGQLHLSVVFDCTRRDAISTGKLLHIFKEELLALSEYCCNRQLSEKTASDFTTRAFSIDTYREFLEANGWNAGDVEDIYRLGPMQQGLLFQSLLDPESDAYFLQTSYGVAGLNAEVFREAWTLLCDRYAILRTAFVHEGLPEPLQVVFKHRAPEFAVLDLNGLSSLEQTRRLERYLNLDRERGFDLRRDPLVRITLAEIAGSRRQIVLSYPHLLLDGWCLRLLYRDFNQIYQSIVSGKEPGLPAAPPYSDYIRWLDGQDTQSTLSFWKNYLAGYDAVVSLPKPLQPSASSGCVHEELSFAIDPEVTAALNAIAAPLGVTLNTVVQVAWSVLLSRYNQSDDVVFGIIVSGRPAELVAVDEMVGLFINCLPVRIRLKDEESIISVLERTQRAFLETQPHQYLALVEIHKQSALGSDLFDHLLIFENYPVDRESSLQSNLAIDTVQGHDRTHYAFDLTAVPGDSIQIKFSYDARAYQKDQMERTAEHLQQIIRKISEDPHRQIDSIDILSKRERQQVTLEFSNADCGYPDHRDVWHRLFEVQVVKTPEAPAVAFEALVLTYAELNRRANQLGRYLRGLGVGPDVLIGLCVERSLEMIVGVLGILKAGGAYVPLDPFYPEERLSFMLSDAGVSVLLTQRNCVAFEVVPGTKVVYLDEVSTEVSQQSEANLPIQTTPANLVYVIYTSGSTGSPKGVMVEHAGLVSAAHAWAAYYGLNDFDVRLLQIASMSFDVFAGDLVRALTTGGQLVICPADCAFNAAALYEIIARYRITIFESTPAIISPLMEYVYMQGLDVSFLRFLICGSDSLPWRQYRGLVQRFGATMRIVNSYGVTEATVDSCEFEDHGLSLGVRSTPIGRPLPNTRCYLSDRLGRPVPIGVGGQLHIAGPGVARGYLGRSSLTAERFSPNPYQVGERMYATGDLARWLPDGNLEMMERLDDQVKIRGCRVELGEIESCILTNSGVNEAVVIARELNTKEKELVAYVAPRIVEGDSDINLRNLRTFIKERLPSYMVPSYLVRVDKLPLLPNGKLDKKALPDPISKGAARYVGPRDVLENDLARIWREVLQVDTVGITDNFFELGGHSLKAMQIVSAIHRQCSIKISVRELFNAPTIREFASIVRMMSVGSALETIQPVPAQESYVLSHAQQRLWFLHQIGTAAAYNMPEAFIIDGEVDLIALRSAFDALIQRHETLRTAFVVVEGEPRQAVRSDSDFALHFVDLSNSADPLASAQEIANSEANYHFDLAMPPLFRATLVRISANQHLFIFVMHHIIGDGWSGVILDRELMSLYDAYHRGLPNPLKPLKIQYKDFAVWQQGRDFSADREYWLSKLVGRVELLRLPCDIPPQEDRDFRGDAEKRLLGVDIAPGLRSMATMRNTSLSNVVLAIFKFLLFRLTKQEYIPVGVSIANRNHPDLEGLIGFFVNILPIRTRVSKDMDFDELLEQVSLNIYEAFEHQDYPFDLLVQDLNPNRYGNRQPIVNVIYGFQNFADVRLDLGGEQDSGMPPENNVAGTATFQAFDLTFKTSKFDLTLFVEDQGHFLDLTMEYDTGLFFPESIRTMLAEFEKLARTLSRTQNSRP